MQSAVLSTRLRPPLDATADLVLGWSAAVGSAAVQRVPGVRMSRARRLALPRGTVGLRSTIVARGLLVPGGMAGLGSAAALRSMRFPPMGGAGMRPPLGCL